MIYRLIINVDGTRRFTVITLDNLTLEEYMFEHNLDFKYSEDLDAIVLVPLSHANNKKEVIIDESEVKEKTIDESMTEDTNNE